MARFGSDYSPTPAEGFRNAALLVFALAFGLGAVFVTWNSPPNGLVGRLFQLIVPLALLGGWVLSLRKVVSWLEWKRPVQAGEWRTTRAYRLATLVPSVWFLGYGGEVSARMVQAWTQGDWARFGVGTAVVVASAVFMIMIAVRVLRVVLELKIDSHGVYAHQWRGLVPWEAIDFVLPGRLEDDSPRLVLKPEALAGLPAPVRRRNGFLDLNLGATSLTASAALEALSAAYPALEVRRSRSAGVVLPVRGATDIVEADL